MPYLFALISIILLIPFVMFLNLGITKKGKLSIVALSLLISVLGMLAQMSYPLWQIALIILLLGLVSSYLLNERYEMFLFQTNIENDQNDHIEDRISYLNTIQILEEEEEGSVSDSSSMNNSTVIEEVRSSPLEEIEIPPHDDIPSDGLEEDNTTGIEEEKNNQDLIDHLIKSLTTEKENDFKINELLEPFHLDKEDKVLIESIEEIIKDGEYPSNSQQSVDEILNEEIHSNTIAPIEVKELSEDELVKETFLIEDLEEEMEEVKPILFSNSAVDRTIINKTFDFDEDEIVPIKEFKPVQVEVETIVKIEEPLKKEQPVKKENYLSEIEKLLEED